jgi:hypothetical protein
MRFNAASNFSGSLLTVANAESRIITGGTVSSVTQAAAEHQISIAFSRNNAGNVYSYGEFYDTGGAQGDVAISRANMGVYSSPAIGHYSGILPLGSWSMQIDTSVATQKITLAGTVGNSAFTTLNANTSNPALASSNTMEVFINGSDVRFDYFVVIETMP